MGSYCTLSLDRTSICKFKNHLPDQYFALFQESDLQPPGRRSSTIYGSKVVYSASKNTILQRLDLMGINEDFVESHLEQWLLTTRATWQEYAENGGWADATFKILQNFSTADWRSRSKDLKFMGRKAFQKKYPDPEDVINARMNDLDGGWLWLDDYGSLTVLRALLDAKSNVASVRLDISDLVDGGWLEGDGQYLDVGKRHFLVPNLFAPTVIIGEGVSDGRLLEKSLAKMFPELVDFFTFFDHSELNVDGGTSYLLKFLKAFASARAPFRMIAVFDNDTAGVHAYRQALSLRLPTNLIPVKLPDIKLAEDYPTIGPQGNHFTNVNGQAAGIELYLGAAALEDCGNLRNIRWTSYDSKAKSYQGEVEGKGEVQTAFLANLNAAPDADTARASFPEMVQVWKSIFEAVAHSSEVANRQLII